MDRCISSPFEFVKDFVRCDFDGAELHTNWVTVLRKWFAAQ